jgi:hypothetical protein
MIANIGSHKFSKHLRGWLVFRFAGLKKAFAQLALHPNAKSYIFHRVAV